MANPPPPLPPPMPPPYGENWQPPKPPKSKGLSGCVIAVLVVIGLVILGVGAGAYWFSRAIGGSEGIARKAIEVANPDYDVIDFDKEGKTITVKHRKTGKTGTISLSHMQNGRIDPADLGLTEEDEGTGLAPSWVKYPGAKRQAGAQILGMTTLVYQTGDSLADVRKYFTERGENMTVKSSTDQAFTMTRVDSSGMLQITVTEGKGDMTVITIVFKSK